MNTNRNMWIEVIDVGKEHRGIKSIYKEYEDWEINTLQAHEPIKGNPNRKLSIKFGMFMYITPEYHDWLHTTEEGQKQDKVYKREMQVLCMEVHDMTEEEFREIFKISYL